MSENLNVKLLHSIIAKGKEGFTNDNKTKGLYFRISSTGSASWALRYRDRRTSRQRMMGLGPYPTIGLSRARELAQVAQAQLKQLKDPIDERKEQLRKDRVDKLKQKTVKQFFDEWLVKQTDHWHQTKNAKEHIAQFNTYVYPKIGQLPISHIQSTDVAKVLAPIWKSKHDAALKLRGRIYKVLESAMHSKLLVDSQNPAQKASIESVLGTTSKKVRQSKPVKHHDALSFTEMPTLCKAVAEQNSVAANALLLKILCATRNHEVTHTEWSEINFKSRVWTVNKARMGKNDSDHRIPLSKPAINILKSQQGLDERFVFPSLVAGQPISREAPQRLIIELGWRPKTSAHGLRKTFKTWSIAQKHQHIISEWALAHYNDLTKTEMAYIDDNEQALFEIRRAMMDAWATYCCQEV